MSGDGTVRAITDLVFRRGVYRPESTRSLAVEAAAPEAAPVLPARALRTFLSSLADRDSPILLDLGLVVGPNVTFSVSGSGVRFLSRISSRISTASPGRAEHSRQRSQSS